MGHKAVESLFQELGFPNTKPWLPAAVAYSVARTYSLLARDLSQHYARFDLTPPSFNLLMLLKHGMDPGEMTQQEIGRRLAVSPSDMTGLIDRLEKRGLVRRMPGKDRRKKLLRITPQGTRLLDEVWPHHEQAIEKRCGALTIAEATQLVESLGKLRAQCG